MAREVGTATVPASPRPNDRRRRSRRTIVLAAPIAVLSAASLTGNVLAPPRVGPPLLLMSLSPRTVYLAIAAGEVPMAGFLLIGMLRLCAADAWHFLLGSLHGDRLERVASRMPRFCRQLGLPVVALFPSGKVLLLAGATRMPHGRVAATAAAGTLVQLVTVYAAGRALAGPLDALTALVSGSAAAVIAATVAAVAVGGARGLCRRRSSPAPAPRHAAVPGDGTVTRSSRVRHRVVRRGPPGRKSGSLRSAPPQTSPASTGAATWPRSPQPPSPR